MTERNQTSAKADGAAITTERVPSGIRLATESMTDVRSVAIGFWVGTGSRDEPEAIAGASHFLEHLLFKGTSTRSAAAIAEALDEVGGDCNAFTTKEYTAFYVRLLSEHMPLGLGILADIMEDPALAERDVDSERTVILDEILMHADEPADLAGEQAMAALFSGHPVGRDTLGTSSSVRAIRAGDIRGFFEQHYRPGNIVVSVAGDCRHEDVARALEGRFEARPGGAAPAREAVGPDVHPLVVVRRPTEQAHLVLAMRAVSRFDDARWPLAVLNVVLGERRVVHDVPEDVEPETEMLGEQPHVEGRVLLRGERVAVAADLIERLGDRGGRPSRRALEQEVLEEVGRARKTVRFVA